MSARNIHEFNGIVNNRKQTYTGYKHEVHFVLDGEYWYKNTEEHKTEHWRVHVLLG